MCVVSCPLFNPVWRLKIRGGAQIQSGSNPRAYRIGTKNAAGSCNLPESGFVANTSPRIWLQLRAQAFPRVNGGWNGATAAPNGWSIALLTHKEIPPLNGVGGTE
jgi:hypothetical protein